jgi:hypothetical protein
MEREATQLIAALPVGRESGYTPSYCTVLHLILGAGSYIFLYRSSKGEIYFVLLGFCMLGKGRVFQSTVFMKLHRGGIIGAYLE